MDKLEEMQDLLGQLINMDSSVVTQYPDWSEQSDDIIRMLRDIHSFCSRSCLLSPPNTASSSCSTHSDFGTDDYLAHATNAFNRQIYSRCVQIVETAQQNEEHIQIGLIRLAHQSYMAMVDDADNETDATKIARWWKRFLEECESNCHDDDELVNIMELRLQSLERLKQLTVDENDTIINEVIITNENIYNAHCTRYRPFHPRTLRRLEKLNQCLQEMEYSNEDNHIDGRNTVQQSIHNSRMDKTLYDSQIKQRLIQPYMDYNMCALILKNLSSGTTINIGNVYNNEKNNNNDSYVAEKVFNEETAEKQEIIEPDEHIILRL